MSEDSGQYKQIQDVNEIKCQIHFVLVVAVEVERRAVLNVLQALPSEEKVIKAFIGNAVYFAGKIGLYNCILVMCEMGAVGRNSSIMATSSAIKNWQPSSGIIMPGIAFGRFPPQDDNGKPNKQMLGDVIVATQIIIYEPERVGLTENVSRGAHPETSLSFLNRLRNLDWYWTPQIDGNTLPQRKPLLGPLLSGEKLVDKQEFKEKLFDEFSNAIGGEMEGAGVYAAASTEHKDWIIIKGICDWADGSKHNDAQALAAKNSIDVVSKLLEEPGFAQRENTSKNNDIMRKKIENIRQTDKLRRLKLEAFGKQLAVFQKNKKGKIKIPKEYEPTVNMMKQEHSTALEDWLNAYEDACSEYLLGIGRRLFETSIGQEIKELIENKGPQKIRLFPRESSPYKSIHEVYQVLFIEEV